MRIVIDIPDHIYKTVVETGKFSPYRFNTVRAIKNSIVIPKGHGRLGDLDEIKIEMQNYYDDCAKTSEYTRLGVETAMAVVENAPTIIESEGKNADSD